MSTVPLNDLLGTVLTTRHGHFRLESGLHAREWLDLEALFVDPASLAPRIEMLATLLRDHDFSAVCGPLVGGAFVAQAVAARMGRRFYFTERQDGPQRAETFGVTYRLPVALRKAATSERFAVVDDVVSAGSSVRATVDALVRAGSSVAVVGALMVLGERAVVHLTAEGIPLVSQTYRPLETWEAATCPLCLAGEPLVEPWSGFSGCAP